MHQCLKCKKMYEDSAVPVVSGCECGARLFLFIKNENDIEKAEEIKEDIEQKIREIEEEAKQDLSAGQTTLNPEAGNVEKPIKDTTLNKERKKFGVETIRMQDIGVYEINIEALMRGRPIIVLSKGGSYVISLPSAFGKEDGEKISL